RRRGGASFVTPNRADAAIRTTAKTLAGWRPVPQRFRALTNQPESPLSGWVARDTSLRGTHRRPACSAVRAPRLHHRGLPRASPRVPVQVDDERQAPLRLRWHLAAGPLRRLADREWR